MSVTNLKVRLARRIREARELRGWNQVEMAGKMNIQPPSWNLYEKGVTEVTVERLVQIARVTEREVSYFLPELAKPDLAAALRALYPEITPAQIMSVEQYAAYVVSGLARVNPGAPDTSRQDETPSDRTGNTTA